MLQDTDVQGLGSRIERSHGIQSEAKTVWLLQARGEHDLSSATCSKVSLRVVPWPLLEKVGVLNWHPWHQQL